MVATTKLTVINTLMEKLGTDVVTTGSALHERATSYWDVSLTQARALLRPRNTAEVSEALSICHALNQPVVTQGGLTGCVGGSVSGPLVAMESFDQVISLLKILQRDLAGTLSAYEVMWGDYFHALTDEGGHPAPMDRHYPFYVLLEAEGADPEYDGERLNTVLERASESGVIVDAVIPKSESERRALWDMRENFERILHPKPVYLCDLSLPIRNMAAYIHQVKSDLKRRWPESHCYVLGHIADGNLHLFVQPGREGDLHYKSDLTVYGPLQAYNGSVSAEHGIGEEKKAWLKSSRSDAEIKIMRALKHTFDPKNLLNPGKMFDVGSSIVYRN